MQGMPPSVHTALRRLRRRLTIGLFLDAWPSWAVAALLAAGITALACRFLFPAAAPFLRWLWLAPLLTALPVAVSCVMRRYRPMEVAALADSLSGGHGLLLAQIERQDVAWLESPLLQRAAALPLPRIHPWRKLAPVLPSALFLGAALAVPQRTPAASGGEALAREVAGTLTATLQELKQQALVTPEEEKRLEEEIERIRQAASQRVDPASWEAADALREQLAADVSKKSDALKWAEQSLARYAAAAKGGAGAPSREASAAELSRALAALAQNGMLAGAPPELQRLLKGGRLPGDAASMQQLTAALAKYLSEAKGRVGDVAGAQRGFGRFDPKEFPLGQSSEEADGKPGRGGVNRGRADADLTWGKETAPFDTFKAKPLPPGAARSPDDWTPIVELPGAPQTSAAVSTAAAARSYDASAGQSAWRRTLAPRHRSAVKKYFDK